jgi:hypothetical protein
MFTVRTLIDGIADDKDFPDNSEYVAWAYFDSTVSRIRRSGWFEATVQLICPDGTLAYEETVSESF